MFEGIAACRTTRQIDSRHSSSESETKKVKPMILAITLWVTGWMFTVGMLCESGIHEDKRLSRHDIICVYGVSPIVWPIYLGILAMEHMNKDK